MANLSLDEENTIKKWELIKSDMALDEKWFPVRRDTIKLPSGRQIDDYYVWLSPDIATVVPVTEKGEFILVKQYRHAANVITFQFPAGAIDNGEDPAVAAMRELEEETGYVADEAIPLIDKLSVYPTKLTGFSYLYLAKNARLVSTPKIDDQEVTEVVTVSREEFEELVNTSRFFVADSLSAGLLALRYLDKN